MATIETRKTEDGKTHFRVKVRLKGRPSETMTFERKSDAAQWAKETEVAIKQGKYFAGHESKRRTFTQLADRYLRDIMPRKRPSSQYSMIAQLEWWRGKLGPYTLADCTPQRIAELRDEFAAAPCRTGQRPSPTTVGRYLALLSHVFSVAVKELSWLDANPVQRVRKPSPAPGRVRYLDDAERARLLAACETSLNRDLSVIVMLALCSGMRLGEIKNLTWDKVDVHRCTITLAPEDVKNATRRTVPLVNPALDILRGRAKLRRLDTNLVFPAPARHRQKPRPLDFQSAWKYALKVAQISDFKFHDLRHTCASYLAMSGASLTEIGAILGHKTAQMSLRYSHLSPQHSAAVLGRMAAAVFNPQPDKEAAE